jgi:transcriptional regulator with XRE-family HTH domain
MSILAENIKKVRENLNLNQTEFGKLVGLETNSAISNYENGKREPDIATLMRIAEIGNVTLDWLIRGINIEDDRQKEIDQKDSTINELIKIVGVQRVQSDKINDALEVKKRKGLSPEH